MAGRTLLLGYSRPGWIGVETIGGPAGASAHVFRGSFADPTGAYEPGSDGTPRLHTLLAEMPRPGGEFMLILEGETLYRLAGAVQRPRPEGQEKGTLVRLAEHVLTARTLSRATLAVVRTTRPGAARFQIWKIEGSGSEPVGDLGEEVLRAEFIRLQGAGRDEYALATECAPGRWTIRSDQATFEMAAFSESEVVGVAPMSGRGGVGLVLAESGRTRLSVVGLSESRRLGQLAAAPLALAVSPWAPHLAWLTAHELVIMSLETGAVLYRICWEAA